MSIEIHWSPTFLCDGLLNPVRFDHTAVVKHDDKSFLKVIKYDRKMERLLLGESDEEKVKNMARPLSHTDIIENLLQLREAKYKELVGELQKDAAAQKSTGLNEEAEPARKISQAMLDQLPKFATIDAPLVGGVASRKMQVVLESNARPPLYMELTTSNFEYLQKAVAHQIEAGTTKRKAPRSSDKGGLAVGVSRINSGRSAGCLRVVTKTPAGEKSTASCTFKAESSERANEIATDFVENSGATRKRSRRTDDVEQNEVENEGDNVEPDAVEHDTQSPAVEEEEDV